MRGGWERGVHECMDEGVAAGRAEHRQHVLLVGMGGTDMAGEELGGMLQLGE